MRPHLTRRADHDFYPTPPEAVRALLSVEAFDGAIWEPACGNGAISRELERSGHHVVSTDLIDRGYGASGNDFLCRATVTRVLLENAGIKHVITNPPYGYEPGIADRFVGQALHVTRSTSGKVAMLLNLGSLAHPTRTAKWRNQPPAAIYALDDLVCWPNGDQRQAGRCIAEHRYCWVVWKPGHTGPASFWWLSTAEFRQKDIPTMNVSRPVDCEPQNSSLIGSAGPPQG